MNKTGPIVVIEDDADDQEMILEIFERMNHPNKIMCFSNGNDALAYLQQADVFPFLILSDINMPAIDGFQVREQVYTNSRLRDKCIPYLFFTTSSNKTAIKAAYALATHGYFVKPNNYEEFVATLQTIMAYWLKCMVPATNDGSQYLKVAS